MIPKFFPVLLPFVAAIALAPAPASAAGGSGAEEPSLPSSRLEVAMTLYAGGITMGHMDLDATLRGADYHAVSTMQTSGVVNAFWQSEIQATASGKLDAKGFTPALYDSFDTGHSGKKQQVSLTYDGSSPPRLFADPVYSTTGYEVKPDDTRNTLDPLSAVTFIFSGVGTSANNPCGVTAPVFDGRRRYDIEMSKIRDVDIKMDNGLYTGKGVECEVRYHQIAGFRPRVLRANESFPLIHAWMANFPSQVGGRTYTVPVRVWADTKYGVLAMIAKFSQSRWRKPQGRTLTDRIWHQAAVKIVTKAQQTGCRLLRVRNSASFRRQNPNSRIGHYIWWLAGRMYPAKCMRTKADIELVSDSDTICSWFVSVLNTASTASPCDYGNPWLQKLPPDTNFMPCARAP